MGSCQIDVGLKQHKAPIEIPPEEFRRLGHGLIDQIADFLVSLPERPVTRGESPSTLRQILGTDEPLPQNGSDPESLLKRTAELLFDYSLHNGHPRFWGYITSSAAPIGALGDLLAAAVNPNAGAWALSPVATEIEGQTIRWIAELIGYPVQSGGLLVSGGNMANFVGFLVARAAKAGWDVRKLGLSHNSGRQLRIYTSRETHTWIHKAADLAGLGTDAIRWIPTDDRHRMNIEELRRQMEEDREQGDLPFLVVGTAGSVSTGAIDPLSELAAICRETGAWFHVDGAYGAFAAAVPGFSRQFGGLEEADSVAVDPHKWLYAPLEAGCVLVRDPEMLRQTFSYHPTYYHFDREVVNYFEQGPQNSRGFRALKVWLALRQAGRSGYVRMIGDDIQLAQELSRRLAEEPELEVLTQSLSITTFRYVPVDLKNQRGNNAAEEHLNQLNQELLGRLEKCGKVFLSNASIDSKFALRACIVNFRTSSEDISILPNIVCQLGREVEASLRLKTS